MEKVGLKKMITAMFHSSFSITACGFTSRNISDAVEVPVPVSSRNISDAVEVPVPVSSHHHHHLFRRFHHHDQNHVLPPPPPPPPPLPSVFVDFNSCRPTRWNTNKKERSTDSNRSTEKKLINCPSDDDDDQADVLFSSDEERNKQIKGKEREPMTSFSSKSFSSDSSDQFYNKNGSNGVVGKEGTAVVKNSCDPYGDFRSSVMEMIIENDIVGPKELEQLLRSYLALNSRCHHPIILQVFCDVWDALFSN